MNHAVPGMLAAVLFSAVPLGVHAQSYTPPKMIKQGSATTAFGGVGAVTLKIFVKADGSIGAVEVEKSTNARDNAPATEIAKTSTYTAGVRDGKRIDAFYTVVLNFTANSVAVDGLAPGSELADANAMLRAGKYTEAKSALQAYLTKRPDDSEALAMLGVADGFLDDAAGAAAAFDKAGTVPERFRSAAIKAYVDAAIDALKARNNERAVALASKGIALQESVNALFVRGTAYANVQNYNAAIADLENAKAKAVSGRADAATLTAIDSALVTSYLFAGQSAKGLALAQAVKAREPANTRIDDTLAAYYNQQAAAAIAAGKRDDAVALLESAASAVPARAVFMYVQAANVLSQGTTVDWKRVKAEADKALAINAADGRANYVAGVSLANAKGDMAAVIAYLEKAKANAGSDTSLAADADAALKKLRPRP